MFCTNPPHYISHYISNILILVPPIHSRLGPMNPSRYRNFSLVTAQKHYDPSIFIHYTRMTTDIQCFNPLTRFHCIMHSPVIPFTSQYGELNPSGYYLSFNIYMCLQFFENHVDDYNHIRFSTPGKGFYFASDHTPFPSTDSSIQALHKQLNTFAFYPQVD